MKTGSLAISKDNHNVVRIRIRDDVSNIRFVELRMSREDFADAMLGLCEVKGEMETMRLGDVGKVKVREKRSIVCPIETYDRDLLESWLKENAKEDGWELDPYLGSQGSVSYASGGRPTLHYAVFKFVDKDSE